MPPPNSLLDDGIIGVSRGGDHAWLTLPQVLHALSTEEDVEFTGIRAHQHHAWHAFLVQLGALVAHRGGAGVTSLSLAGWREALMDLSAGVEEAWWLTVDELARPAFLQPPVPEGDLSALKKVIERPDSLDVLVTGRNHDEKAQRMANAKPEHWIYALVTLQTMEGFSGRDNYGIVRMNGGFGSRPSVGLAPGIGWTTRFRRDVAVWRDSRPALLTDYGYPDRGGFALLWALQWDGEDSLDLQSCDPFFVEICRRVRLLYSRGRIAAKAGLSSCARVSGAETKGDTGDPWVPVGVDGKALSVGANGFSYRLLTDLLFSGDYARRTALIPRKEDGDEPWFIGRVLSRGKGATAGFHIRHLPVPAKVRLKLGSRETRLALAQLARGRVEQADAVERKVLHRALCVLLQGAPSTKGNYKDRRTRKWIDRLDSAIDQVFFDELWASVDLTLEEARRRWDRLLFTLAERELETAIHAAPVPRSRATRAIAMAEIRFHSLARQHLSGAFEPEEPKPTHQEENMQ
jgi:CRISPR system Cascade subunit CasA